MNKIVKTISSVMVIFALLITGFNAPVISVASAQTTGFDFPSFDFPSFDFPSYDFDQNDTNTNTNNTESEWTSSLQTCNLTASQTQIVTGGNVTLNWNTSGFDTFTLNGQTLQSEDGSIQMTNVMQNTTYELVARTVDNSADCVAKVTVKCIPPPPGECELRVTKAVDKATAHVGDTLTYTITVKNIGGADCTGGGVKIEDVVNSHLTYQSQWTSGNISAGYGNYGVYTAGDRTLRFNGNTLNPGEEGTITWTAKVNTPNSCGDFEIPNQAKATAYELNNFGTWAYSQTVKTLIDNDCQQDPAPSCDSFTANPSTIMVGGSSVLSWNTSHATRVVINNGIGDVAADGSTTVSPLATTVYRLTVFGTENRSVNCEVPVTVSQDEVPVCEYFTASPNSLSSNGGNVTLNWKTVRANNVSISPNIGGVSAEGSRTVNVTSSTNFVLTATDLDGDTVSCAAPVTVAQQEVFTCENNVTFTATDYNIEEGDDTTLNWSTSNVDSVSISNINATSLSGSRTVDPRNDTTYVLTAKKGNKSVDCPLTIRVDEDNGGGGGGSKTPRCELTISDKNIKRGDQITLRWKTSNATEVKIKDNHGKTLIDTDKYLSRDKDEYYDGSLKLKPTRDTEYTLTAERGSKDRTCKVKVDVDDITVLTDRDQKPLVSGIALSNVPYTGFEAGPLLTMFFYTLLIAWALLISYLIVIRRRPVVQGGEAILVETPSPATLSMKQAESVRPDVFAETITPTYAHSTVAAPANLPTGTPVIGYANAVEVRNPVNPHHVTDEVVTAIENRAHAQYALLSSDAIRHFISTTAGNVERNEALDKVISEAKTQYPLEDGWIIINEARMQNLCEACQVNAVASQAAPYVPAVVPTGSSSLAEAIVTGNIVAAYEMIGNRPMFALADAAADLDSVVRARRGENVSLSALLKTETDKLSDDKLKNMIAALTGAIDGTYSDEASAVKMAIMKAVKEVA
ncbi:MAG TPA: DUF11 domain-containing protein [Candidatus Paceibacterota bacterium]